MAKKKKTTRTVYRDSLTGKFASKATYKRSKAQGGTRYVRSSVSAQRLPTVRKPSAVVPALPLAAFVKTWFVTLKYTNQHGARTFDFFVRAQYKRNVMKYILRFAKEQSKLAFTDDDPRAKSVIEYLGSFGWNEKRIAEIPAGEFPEYENEKEGFVAYQ